MNDGNPVTGVLQSMFEVMKRLPGIRGIVQRENAKMLVKFWMLQSSDGMLRNYLFF